MRSSTRALLLICVLVGLVAAQASAQAPKAGKDHVDDTDLGYRFKRPKDWGFFPSRPNELHVIGKYDAGSDVILGGSSRFRPSVYLVKFDRRKGPDGEPPKSRYEDVYQWVKRLEGGQNWREVSSKSIKLGGIESTELVFEGVTTDVGTAEVAAYVVDIPIEPDVDLALVFTGPGGRKWSKYHSVYRRMAKSFKRVEREVGKAAASGVGAGSVRARKRAELEDQIRRQPGWRLLESPNYFVVTNSDDEEFLEELIGRIEAIRAVYEVDYPPSTARQAKVAGKDVSGEEPAPEESTSIQVDPMELSRTSVVRVCKSREDYLAYDAPPRSAGYWSSRDKELVLYNKKAVQGEAATWETLSHEAFHQYIYYFYGSLAPHSWYNEGTGDYYGGFTYKRKKFQRNPRRSRKDGVKKLHREERLIPLVEFVRFSQGEYYGGNAHGNSQGECYAQGWSLIYFLRSGGKGVKGWDKDWGKILERYLEALLDTGDLDAAVDAAFAGVDWDRLESAWKNFIAKNL